ncbi:hypothetical protein AT5G44306 [Arabidopsis thaliana]|uniref:Uncharacterized protein n=1 Tax=Arabidopsis thaliana TaxID=3702 RepID=B3H5H2_ARATH|nr:uncharacterized protein AT5G44306 [Arabidopsis thaliana]AED95092.1 hypothetical protein AT5G44306 [Arabidopsis thaliana]|eukprot:NP_001119370.1 hypothetical protein AT5G44306 [Arabidopsis thaliana]
MRYSYWEEEKPNKFSSPSRRYTNYSNHGETLNHAESNHLILSRIGDLFSLHLILKGL